MKKKLVSALTAAGMLSMLVGSTIPSVSAAAKKDSGMGTVPLVESLGHDPDSITPGMGSLAVDDGPKGLLNSSLVYLDINDHWQGLLATKWTVSKDGLTYTFNLNQKAKWSDGSPLTAEDFVYSWHYYTDAKLNLTYVTGWDKLASVTAPNKSTVVFKLKSVYAPFMETIAASAPIEKAVYSKVSDDSINKGYFNDPSHSVSSGPYMLQSWSHDQQMGFVPNPNWFGPAVHIPQVVYKIIPNDNTAFNELLTGDLTIGSVSPQHLSQKGSLASNYNLISPLGATYGLIQLDEFGFLKDVKVRQALDYATPKDQIVKYILHGMGVVAHGDQVPGGYWYNPNIHARGLWLAKASQLLKDDGFTKGSDGWLQKDGKRLEIPVWTGSTSVTYMNIAQVVSQSWEKIGVYAPVKTADWSFVFGNSGPQFDGKDEALIFSWGQGVFPDDTIDFNSKFIPKNATDPGENGERYSNPLMDKLTEEGTATADDKARQKIYYQIQQLEYDEVPIIFIYWTKSLIAVSNHLNGYQQTTFGTTPIWTWTLN